VKCGRRSCFYDLPEVFAVAMLAGFFVTDVLSRERWRAHVPKIVAILTLLMLLDHWPNQRRTKETDVPDRTLANLGIRVPLAPK